MKTIVCIKGIAVSKTEKDDGIDEFNINKKDMYALKSALTLKKKYSSKIEVICMAPLSIHKALKSLFIYGVDQIYLATDNLFTGADTFVTSFVLYKMIKKIGMADIVLCGKSSEDSGTAQIGPSLAERLQCRLISNISAVELTQEYIKCESGTENTRYIIKTQIPIVGTVDFSSDDERYPSLRNILGRKKDIIAFTAKDIGVSEEQLQSKTKVIKLFSYEQDKNGEFVQGDIADKAKRLIDIIKIYN